MRKRYHIITFGCQMNEHDSEQIAGLLGEQGYRASADPRQADVIVVNTCSVREKAQQKVFSLLGRLRDLKRQRPELILAVCGCLAQGLKARVRARAPYVDLVFGTQNIEQLPVLLQRVEKERRAQVEIVQGRKTPTERRNPVRASSFKAWVAIMEGCDNFCAYCMVPYVRGRERSRPSREIVREVRRLAREGIKEITLLGQNVNSYGRNLAGEVSFSGLLYLLHEIEGIERIRFLTSHPKDFGRDLVRAMRELPKVCEHVHLPLQAGSDAVLQAMNRRYTAREYLEKVRLLREAVPEVEISTDIIVGFPGEDEEDFARTLWMLRQVRFDSLFSFIYSDRPPTRDKIKAPRVPGAVARERFQRLWRLQDEIAACKSRRLVGRRMQLLVEGPSKNNPLLLSGRTRSNRLVHFEGGKELTGRFVTVKISAAGKHSLRGRLLELDG